MTQVNLTFMLDVGFQQSLEGCGEDRKGCSWVWTSMDLRTGMQQILWEKCFGAWMQMSSRPELGHEFYLNSKKKSGKVWEGLLGKWKSMMVWGSKIGYSYNSPGQNSEDQDKGGACRNGKERMCIVIKKNFIELCEWRLTGHQGEKGIKMVIW